MKTKVDSFEKDKMYTLVEGVGKSGQKKSIEVENGKLRVYQGSSHKGIFFMAKDAIKRYNEL